MDYCFDCCARFVDHGLERNSPMEIRTAFAQKVVYRTSHRKYIWHPRDSIYLPCYQKIQCGDDRRKQIIQNHICPR